MRGQDMRTGSIFSYVDLEERVPASHPLRKIRAFVNAALAALDDAFAKLYSADGRPSIAPERLLRAALIQILFSIRSERQLMEQMQYNLLFRWFAGLGIDDPVWVPTVFTKNRDRLLNTDIARQFLAAILAHKDVAPLLSRNPISSLPRRVSEIFLLLAAISSDTSRNPCRSSKGFPLVNPRRVERGFTLSIPFGFGNFA